MAYIGRGVDKISNIEVLDAITFTDSAGPYNLLKDTVAFVPTAANALVISVDGVIQSPASYTTSAATITFDSVMAASSTMDFIYQIGTGVITSPSDDSVTTAKLANLSVTAAKLATDAVETAKVQIVLPEQRLFAVTQPPVTASVLIRRVPDKELNDDIVFSVIQYIANAVENLQPENVSVIDTEGHVLSLGIFERMAARQAGLLEEGARRPDHQHVMGQRVHRSVVGFLIHHQPFCARGDQRPVFIRFHWADLKVDVWHKLVQCGYAISKVTFGDKLWVFTGHQQDIAKSLCCQRARLGQHFLH